MKYRLYYAILDGLTLFLSILSLFRSFKPLVFQFFKIYQNLLFLLLNVLSYYLEVLLYLSYLLFFALDFLMNTSNCFFNYLDSVSRIESNSFLFLYRCFLFSKVQFFKAKICSSNLIDLRP